MQFFLIAQKSFHPTVLQIFIFLDVVLKTNEDEKVSRNIFERNERKTNFLFKT